MRERSAREAWAAAFYEVMSSYQESKSVIGTSGAVDYAKALLSPDTNIQQSCCTVVPSLIDFCADVESVTKKALSPSDHEFFVRNFIKKDLNDLDTSFIYLPRTRTVAENAGRKYIVYGLSPVRAYMTPVQVKRNHNA